MLLGRPTSARVAHTRKQHILFLKFLLAHEIHSFVPVASGHLLQDRRLISGQSLLFMALVGVDLRIPLNTVRFCLLILVGLFSSLHSWLSWNGRWKKDTNTKFRQSFTANKSNSWSRSCLLFIKARGLYGFITGNTKKPDPSSSDFNKWDFEKSLIMSWLISSMQP